MTTFPASFADDDPVARVAANLEHVRARIVSGGRDPGDVRVVAVTKAFGAVMVRAASAVGLRAVGENYLDEMRAKRGATSDVDVRWHFLGALQSNKIAGILETADVLCSLSRAKEVDRIAALGTTAALYVQVDCTKDGDRNGAAPGEVAELVTRARESGLDVRGLMTVAPLGAGEAREAFHITRDLADEFGLAERSMGMSDDLEIACECGTTEVRVGRALFGPRTAA
jgi:uncharacterized pyridoxal phosphate-containing UPF0001 family protein